MMRRTPILFPLAATLLALAATAPGLAAQRSAHASAEHDAQYAARYEARAAQLAAQHAAHAARYEARAVARYDAHAFAAAFAGPQPRPSYAPQDPADPLWRAARAALNDNDFRRAAQLFREIETRHPRSAYVADAMYFEALALSRLNGAAELRTARERLAQLEARYPDAAHLADARTLAVRIDGQLARMGDANAAVRVSERAAPPPPPAPPVRPAPAPPRPAPAPRAPPSPRGGGDPLPAHCPDDDGVRTAALNALLQMQSAQAVPLLREVMANRDECNAHLRRQAVFLISQKSAGDVEDVLLDAVRNDPDLEVRRRAVFWLSHVGTERAAAAIDEVLRTSADPRMQEHAIFAMSQQRSPRGLETLRAYAMRDDVPLNLRRNAVFWLTQHSAPDQSQYLRQLYSRLTDAQLRETVLMGLAQRRNEGNEAWLFGIARNPREPMQMRKQALFWAGQQATVPARDLVALYDDINDRDMRRHLMFVFSQRNETEIVDKMMDIARRDRDPEVRRQALFWLGQSRDPRVARFLADLVSGSGG